MVRQNNEEYKQKNEEKKEYLKGYERAVRQLNRVQIEIQEIRLSKMCPSIKTDGMPHAKAMGDLSGYAALLEEEEKKYKKALYDKAEKIKDILDRIEKMENEDEKDVLLYRYINLMKWEEIGEMMKYSRQQLHRIHSKALINFKI